jgi:DNA-binding transcriptional MerR regulator
MEKFSVNQLAKLAGVSVRTLHHYDEIGLLKPTVRSEAKYRFYGRDELLRLQQIMLYRELDFTLAQIAEILDDPDFNILKALQDHKLELQKRKKRMVTLMKTIDSTIEQLKTEKMNYKEMYKGFTKEQAEAYKKEAAHRWGEKTINDSEERILSMKKTEWETLKQQGDDIYKSLVKLMHLDPSDKKVQSLIKEHYKMTGIFFNVTLEIYKNLGTMYMEDERFKAFYDRYDNRLAVFLRDAMHVYSKVNSRQ